MSAVDNIMGLTKYMVTLPVTKISLVLIIVFSFITGTVAFFLELGSTLLNSIIYGGSTGILIFGLMTILAGAITTPMINSLNGRHMKMKQSMFLAFVTMLLIAFIYIIGSIVSSFTVNNYTIDALIYACALAFALRTIIIWGTSNISFLKSVPIAAVQPVLIMCMVVVVVFLTTMETNFAPFSLLALMFKIIIACLILMLAIYAFVLVIESPIRRNLGVGGLELLSLFIAHITEESNALESLFEGIGEPIDTLVGVVSFKTKDGVKAILVSPCVHPGPVGSIGGGNMPTILANKMETFTMVCHGPSTHDFNPVSSREINKITDVVNNALESMEYVQEGSPFFQLDYEEAKLGAQFLGKNLILLATFAPDGFDDIEFGVGLSIVKAAEAFDDVENVILVDCHNSFQGEHGRVLAGNKEVFQLLGAVEKLERPAESGKIRVGCAFDPMDDLGRRYGVGQSGVKTMIVQVADQKTAYILLDANNMIMGFRDELIQAVKKIGVDCAEIMTTDAHYVNTLSGGHNPIGVKKQEEIINAVVKCTKNAIEDLEDVDVGCKTSILSGIKTLGPLHATELVTTISSIVAVSRIFAPLVVILALLFAFIWIFYGNIITA